MLQHLQLCYLPPLLKQGSRQCCATKKIIWGSRTNLFNKPSEGLALHKTKGQACIGKKLDEIDSHLLNLIIWHLWSKERLQNLITIVWLFQGRRWANRREHRRRASSTNLNAHSLHWWSPTGRNSCCCCLFLFCLTRLQMSLAISLVFSDSRNILQPGFQPSGRPLQVSYLFLQAIEALD